MSRTPASSGLVVAYAVRRREGVLLFDTGFGFGDPELDAMYHPVARPMADVLGEAGIRPTAIDLIANCHLHPDHAGQNARYAGIPIHVQAAELAHARKGGYTILDWVDGPGVEYLEATGDHELAPGIRILVDARPFARPPVARRRSAGRPGRPDRPGDLRPRRVDRLGRQGGTLERPGSGGAYDTSVARIRAVDPSRVLFAHDRRTLDPRSGRKAAPARLDHAVLGGELAVPCTCNPLQQG